MNFAALFKAFNTVMALRDAAQRLGGDRPPPSDTAMHPASAPGLAGQLEARLTNVVVAALKEAFDRDHARLELERAQLEEQRRRAEDALRAELRRQAADRELGRFRLLAGTALAGWIAAVVMLVARLDVASTPSRGLMVAAWAMLLGALAAAFTAQGRIAAAADGSPAGDAGVAGAAALWLLIAGLALAATSLLF